MLKARLPVSDPTPLTQLHVHQRDPAAPRGWAMGSRELPRGPHRPQRSPADLAAACWRDWAPSQKLTAWASGGVHPSMVAAITSLQGERLQDYVKMEKKYTETKTNVMALTSSSFLPMLYVCPGPSPKRPAFQWSKRANTVSSE